eukprot:1159813-Pelagomonas_calceolata.AAC.24
MFQKECYLNALIQVSTPAEPGALGATLVALLTIGPTLFRTNLPQDHLTSSRRWLYLAQRPQPAAK